jgi:hypothetical protein
MLIERFDTRWPDPHEEAAAAESGTGESSDAMSNWPEMVRGSPIKRSQAVAGRPTAWANIVARPGTPRLIPSDTIRMILRGRPDRAGAQETNGVATVPAAASLIQSRRVHILPEWWKDVTFP